MKNSVTKARDLRKRSTGQEELLWRQLRNRALLGLKFKRQQPIDGYIADFCCFEKRLIIELDGAVHHNSDQAQYDKERDRHLLDQGFRVLRLTNDEIEQDMGGLLDKIKSVATAPSPPAGEGNCDRGNK